MPIKKQQKKLVKAITGLLIMVCASTLLSSTVQSQTSLTACENNKTHKVSFPPVGKSCKSDETAITLGGRGPAGPTGPTGPQGSSAAPSLDLEGTGALVAKSATCENGSCPGTLTASLTGQPFGSLSFSMDVLANQTAGADSCYVTTGLATIGSIDNPSNVNFEGELCLPNFFTYALRGTLTVIPQQDCQSAPWMVSAGELIAYGAEHTFGPTPLPGGNPIPPNQFSSSAIISVIGSTGQIPAPCPNP